MGLDGRPGRGQQQLSLLMSFAVGPLQLLLSPQIALCCRLDALVREDGFRESNQEQGVLQALPGQVPQAQG